MNAGWITLLAAVGLCSPALTQVPAMPNDAGAAMESAIARQRAAIEVQRASIRTQSESTVRTTPGASRPASDSGFFTTAWSMPSSIESVPSAPQCEPVPDNRILPMVREISSREGLTPDLLRAVIFKESRFLPCAVSPKGAMGLMQLMPATARDFGVSDPFDPEQNVGAGARLLKQLMDRYGGNTTLALGAYNAGASRVDLYKGLPPFPETIGYVGDILREIGIAPQSELSIQ